MLELSSAFWGKYIVKPKISAPHDPFKRAKFHTLG